MVSSHYLNQCWNIVNWNLGRKLQWNFIRNSSIFIQENAFENVVWKMAAILSWPQCVMQQDYYGVMSCCHGHVTVSEILQWILPRSIWKWSALNVRASVHVQILLAQTVLFSRILTKKINGYLNSAKKVIRNGNHTLHHHFLGNHLWCNMNMLERG